MFKNLQKPYLQLNRYTFCGFAAIVLWSTTIAIIRSLTEQVGPITSAATIYLIGGFLSLIPLSYSRDRIAQVCTLSRLYLFGCGAIFVFYMLAIYLAVGLASDRQQVLEVGLINYLWPAFTLLFSVFLLGKKARFSLIPGMTLGFLGAFLVLTQGDSISWTSFSRNVLTNSWAYSLALMAAVSWGLYSNLSRRWGGTMSGNAVPFFMVATGLFLLCIRFFFTEESLWTCAIGCRGSLYEPGNPLLVYLLGSGHAKRGHGAGGGIFLFHPLSLNSCKLPLPWNHGRSSTLGRVRLYHSGIFHQLGLGFRPELRVRVKA